MKLSNVLLNFEPSPLQSEPDILRGLEEIRAREVPMGLYQKISRLRREILPYLQDYGEARDELVKRHAPAGASAISSSDPGFPAFLEEWTTLLANEFEIPDELVLTPDDFRTFPSVPGGALARIGPLFREEPNPPRQQAKRPAKERPGRARR